MFLTKSHLIKKFCSPSPTNALCQNRLSDCRDKAKNVQIVEHSARSTKKIAINNKKIVRPKYFKLTRKGAKWKTSHFGNQKNQIMHVLMQNN